MGLGQFTMYSPFKFLDNLLSPIITIVIIVYSNNNYNETPVLINIHILEKTQIGILLIADPNTHGNLERINKKYIMCFCDNAGVTTTRTK